MFGTGRGPVPTATQGPAREEQNLKALDDAAARKGPKLFWLAADGRHVQKARL
jgi:hypothetical protein